MCGRFALTISPLELARQLDLPFEPDLQPRYNIAPSQQLPVLRRKQQGDRELVNMRWGLIPSWSKDPAIGNRMINARGETVAEKPSFRAALKRRRCLVPASGFYEWKQPEDSNTKTADAGTKSEHTDTKRNESGTAKKKGTRPVKQPFYIRPPGRSPDALFCFAGLWEHWTDKKSGEHIESFTIITTAANDFMRSIHDRMPVILDPTDFARWLDPETMESEKILELLRPCPSEKLQAYPVSTLVNNPRNDSDECLVPLVIED